MKSTNNDIFVDNDNELLQTNANGSINRTDHSIQDDDANVNNGCDEYEQQEEHGEIGVITNIETHINLLFALNGLVEALPDLALMSLINDRVKIPVEYLPAYYAIEFLPYSLKPIYALVTYWMTTTSTTTIEPSNCNSDNQNAPTTPSTWPRSRTRTAPWLGQPARPHRDTQQSCICFFCSFCLW